MNRYGIIFVLFLSVVSCESFTPKPKGYFRIEPPAPSYVQIPEKDLPYTFEVSDAAMVKLPLQDESTGWINISYPSLKAEIYCSYIPITPQRYPEVMNESRSLLEWQIKEADVSEREYSNPGNSVYGSLFEIAGEAASPVQFILTDRQRRFFRGALYFDCPFNADSLQPAIDYITTDVIMLIQTFQWK